MIHILQCLCPARHCIFGMAYDDANLNPTEAMVGFQAMTKRALEKQIMNPWCGICCAMRYSWEYEDAETKFATMEEAKPFLEQSEREQAVARSVLGRY
jgi:hypothetical protein